MRIQTRTHARRRHVCALLATLIAIPCAGVRAEPAQIGSPHNRDHTSQAVDLAVRAKLQASIDALLDYPDLAQRVQTLGLQRTIFCDACHGERGISVRPEVPNLAGQSPVYLLDQFQRFGDGRRYDFTMTTLASSFSGEEKAMLALYYSRMTPGTAGGGTREQIAEGKRLYAPTCAACHGETGRGEKGYARLAGQRPTYVINMLREFRNSTGRRTNPWMSAVTQGLSDQEIENLAYFIANME
jgi:cytochrome c553